jgi:bacterioferritin-associated ferredoxin
MVVCHCEAVNDRQIMAAVALGALDAQDVMARCGAGSRCGGCRPSIEDLIDRMARAADTAA